MHYKFSEYTGNIIEKLPFDVGVKAFKLNSVMASGCLDQYVYQNNNGDYFYVTGILQYTDCMMESWKDDKRNYHLALVIPIISKDVLVSYLKSEFNESVLFDPNGKFYIMKMDAPEYNWCDGTSHSMYPVVDREQLHREEEMDITEFELLEIKECDAETFPVLNNPYNVPDWAKYDHGNEDAFIFNKDKDKEKIDKLINEQV